MLIAHVLFIYVLTRVILWGLLGLTYSFLRCFSSLYPNPNLLLMSLLSYLMLSKSSKLLFYWFIFNLRLLFWIFNYLRKRPPFLEHFLKNISCLHIFLSFYKSIATFRICFSFWHSKLSTLVREWGWGGSFIYFIN